MPSAAATWLGRLAELNDDELRVVLDRVPEDRMAPIARDFTLELIRADHYRLLTVQSSIS